MKLKLKLSLASGVFMCARGSKLRSNSKNKIYREKNSFFPQLSSLDERVDAFVCVPYRKDTEKIKKLSNNCIIINDFMIFNVENDL